MKKLSFLFMLLVATPSVSQDSLSLSELINLYVSDKESALRSIELKGYKKASADEHRIIFGQLPEEQGLVFSRSNSTSKIAIGFNKNEVKSVFYNDSIQQLNVMLNELRKSGLKLVRDERPMYEAYSKRKLNYFVWYGLEHKGSNGVAFIAVMPKHKSLKLLYSGKE